MVHVSIRFFTKGSTNIKYWLSAPLKHWNKINSFQGSHFKGSDNQLQYWHFSHGYMTQLCKLSCFKDLVKNKLITGFSINWWAKNSMVSYCEYLSMCLHTYHFTMDQSKTALKDVELIKFGSLDRFIPKIPLHLNQSAMLPSRNHKRKFYEKEKYRREADYSEI